MRKIILIISLLMFINGCYARTQTALRDDQFDPITSSNAEKVAVMLTDDGSYTSFYRDDRGVKTSQPKETEVYLGSGVVVATKVQASLLGLFSQVEMLNTKNKEQASA